MYIDYMLGTNFRSMKQCFKKTFDYIKINENLLTVNCFN